MAVIGRGWITIADVQDGEDGAAGISYAIVPSATAVSYNGDTFTPSTITASIRSIQNGTVTDLTPENSNSYVATTDPVLYVKGGNGRTYIYGDTTISFKRENDAFYWKATYSTSGSTTSWSEITSTYPLTFIAEISGTGKEVARQTVAVVSEGATGKNYSASTNTLVVKCTQNTDLSYTIASEAVGSKIYLSCSDTTVTASSVSVSGTTLTTSTQYLNNIGYSFSTTNQYIVLDVNTNGTLTEHTSKIEVTWSNGYTSTHSLHVVPLVDGSIEDVETTTVYRLEPNNETALITLSGGGTTEITQTLSVNLDYSIIAVTGSTETVLTSLPDGYTLSGAYNTGTSISFNGFYYNITGQTYTATKYGSAINVLLKNADGVCVDSRCVPLNFKQDTLISVLASGVTSVTANKNSISTLTQTATENSSKIETLEGNVSTLTQTDESISARVSDLESTSELLVKSNKIIAKTATFEVQNSSGEATFTIDDDGNINSNGDAAFSGKITATSGTIAGVNINNAANLSSGENQISQVGIGYVGTSVAAFMTTATGTAFSQGSDTGSGIFRVVDNSNSTTIPCYTAKLGNAANGIGFATNGQIIAQKFEHYKMKTLICPFVLSKGTVTYTSSSTSYSCSTATGISATASRTSTGIVKLTFSTALSTYASYYFGIVNGRTNVKGVVSTMTSSYMQVYLSDDETYNDSTFDYLVLGWG